MATGYLVLASERRVIIVQFESDDQHAIERTIGTTTIEHGTTFWSEDQLLVDGGPPEGTTMHNRVQGVPFLFRGNGLLVGTDPMTGDTAERPVMSIHEFTRMINFAVSSERSTGIRSSRSRIDGMRPKKR